MADAGDRPQDSAKAKADAIALAEQAEAEAAEAEALAAAARARARAIRLRREAEAQAEAEDDQAADQADTQKTAEVAQAADTPETAATSTEPGRRRLRVPGRSRLLTAGVVVATCALLVVSGLMVWHHHNVLRERQRSAAFVAVAKQGVINLTSFDFKRAKQDVQRVIDSATGEFREDFKRRADDFATVIKDSKAVTEGSVAAAAVESMGTDSAVVLVLADERVTNLAGAKDEPRTFRFRVSVVRDSDQLKVSKVEFVL
jgi:Mce-associated membrane protein